VTKHRKPANHVYGGAPHSLRKARSVTDTSGHIQFLGWQPTLGEFIINIMWPLVVALLVAFLFEPLRRWLSRKWNFFVDRLSSMSTKRRAKRIQALELKITQLNEYTDRQVMVRLLRGICYCVVLIGSAIMWLTLTIGQMMLTLNSQIWRFLDQIWTFLGQIFQVLFILSGTHVTPHEITPDIVDRPNLLYAQTFNAISSFGLVLLVILSYFSAVNTLQEMADFADPPKAIRKLQERINAMRAKSA
jgi:hypothetical protein